MRLFIAVPLVSNVRRQLLDVQSRIRCDRAKIRWSSEGQLHLTLKFLGETEEDCLPDIRRALNDVAQTVDAFEIGVHGAGCFPPDGAVSVIWVGGDDPSGSLSIVAKEVESRFECLGFPKEKRTFSQHFTIGRVKSDRSRGKLRTVVEHVTFTPTTMQVSELSLYKSDLSPQGARYTAVHRVPLRKKG